MKTAQKFISLLLLASISSRLSGMEEKQENLIERVLPKSLHIQLFEYCDTASLCSFRITRSYFNDLWQKDNEDKVIKAKGQRCTLEQATQKVLLVRHALIMRALNEKQLQRAASDEQFPWFKEILLDNLTTTIIKKIKPQITNSKSLLAAFFAYHTVYTDAVMVIVWDAAWESGQASAKNDKFIFDSMQVAYQAAWEPCGYEAGEVSGDIIYDPDFDKAWETAMTAAWDASRNDVDNYTRDNTSKLAKPAIKNAIETLPIDDAKALNKLACNAMTLYILAYIAQDEYLAYYDKAFSAAMTELESQEIIKPMQEIWAVIADNTWNTRQKPNAANSIFFVILRTIFHEVNPN